MPAKATVSLLALTSLGDATQMGMFLLVLHHPRNLQEVQPLPLFWEFAQQTLPMLTIIESPSLIFTCLLENFIIQPLSAKIFIIYDRNIFIVQATVI
jgi:hypothetical protein